ncbi:MAG: GSCFA domain-containing protein [Bacteroidota bacterium]
MIPFRTTLPVPNYDFQVNYQDSIALLGSCFAENIGDKLKEARLDTLVNPFGIIYNPISLAQHISRVLNGEKVTEDTFFFDGALWRSHLHHSRFASDDLQQLETAVDQADAQLKQFIDSGNCLFLTFGSAYIYYHLEWDGIVANCHKLPAKFFQKRRLTVEEILDIYEPLLQQLHERQSDLQIIFSVSPVRHIRDGIINNQRSKAVLLLAVDQLCEQFDFAHYFPAYEWLLDDLRDYRFYDQDLIHPSATAVDYTWNHFQTAFFSEQTQAIYQQIMQLHRALAHRPFKPKSEAHQQFLKKQLQKVEQVKEAFSFLDLSYFRDAFRERLS